MHNLSTHKYANNKNDQMSNTNLIPGIHVYLNTVLLYMYIAYMYMHIAPGHGQNISLGRRDVPVGAPLHLSTPTGMSCIGTYGENFKTDNVSKYRVLLVAFLLL